MTSDFLVIGSGIAGLRAAIGLAAAGTVTVLTKAEPAESNTGYAQGGIAVAVGGDDSPALHKADTLRAGDGLCDEPAVDVLVTDGPPRVRELIDWGARFDRDADGRLALGREAAHTVRRVLHAGDATGREIARALWERARELPSITIVEHAYVTELLLRRVQKDPPCSGVRFYDRGGALQELTCGAVLIATGGAGRLFSETTNPPVATGDGIALAWRAGARVADLEFVQFHPTALSVPGAPRFLISEAIRGEGARLVNVNGERFMPRYHPDAELAPRDVVARSIAREAQATGGPVFLTLAHLNAAFVRRRFPTIDTMCRSLGLDLTRDPIPVGPAAHYIMGGVQTDADGRTSVPGLFAAGEAACTGVHGANRLASNSLLEGLVFGARTAAAMQQRPDVPAIPAGWKIEEARHRPRKADTAGVSGDVGDLMWGDVGLFRSRDRLIDAVNRLDAPLRAASTADEWREVNRVTVARLIASAALRREESRGAHHRDDFPARDDARWRVHWCDERAGDTTESKKLE